MNQAGNLRALLKAKLLPYQYDLVMSQAVRLLVRKSRRTGYTWAQALRMVLQSASGRNQNVISMRFDASKLVIEDCAYWVQFLSDHGHTTLSAWDVQKNSIRHKRTGATIAALPCVPRLIRGRKGDVFVDEAAHVHSLADILDASRPLQMWGGRVTLISSPFLPGVFSDLSASGQWDVHKVDIYKACKAGLHRRICYESGLPKPTPEQTQQWITGLLEDAGRSASQEYLCQDVADVGGDWLTEASRLIDVPVVSPDVAHGYRFRLSESHSIGVDVGVSDAPTVISYVGADGLLQVMELRGQKLPAIAQFIKDSRTDYTTAIAIDTNGIGRGLADMLAEGCGELIKYCPNTSQWFASHCMRFLGRVWDGTATVSNDPVVVGDIKHTTLQAGKLVLQERTTSSGKRHCDSVPSLALAYQWQPIAGEVHGVWG
jgi:phage FluMu gp28-like protein